MAAGIANHPDAIIELRFHENTQQSTAADFKMAPTRLAIPFPGQSGRSAMSDLSPLSGVKRTSMLGAFTSAFDP